MLKICAACLLFLCTAKFFKFKDENFYETVHKLDYLDAGCTKSWKQMFLIPRYWIINILLAIDI